jgi:hypothetical protein
MTRLYPWTGHVLGCENGVVRVQTNLGEVRATYSGRMLGMIARDRGCAAQVGDQAVLCRWPDNRVTIEDVRPNSARCAQVIELPAR